MKILEVCPYSAGICGVWTRVLEESKRLSKRGFEIKIFSSNAVKGSNEIAPSHEKLGPKGVSSGVKIEILRFPFKKLGGESFMSWDFEKEALNYSPDIIIAHNYRHLHTTKCLKIAEKLKGENKKCKVFLVTHAPFERKLTRTFLQNLIVKIYDLFIGRKTINKFDKILAITKWEMPYLLKLGAKKEKIIYIPNGISPEFFSLKKQAKKEQKTGNFLTNSPSGKSQIKGKKIVVCQALGTRRSKIFYKNFEELGELENIQKPFSIIIPSKLHFLEKEFLESFE